MKSFKIKALSFVTICAMVPFNAMPVGAANEITGQFTFDLSAEVYDYGEAINELNFSISSLDKTGLAALEVDKSSIDAGTFKIVASSTNPFASSTGENASYGLYTDVERVIEGVEVLKDGKTISVDLQTKYNGAGQGTLNYVGGTVARNLSMDITYKVEQLKPFSLTNGTVVKADSTYTQGKIKSAEVEKFSADSYKGINYQYYKPSNANDGSKHSLIVWFHGNGEGGYSEAQNNNSQLRGNRGAVAFATDEAQKIFGGAYVLAPQAPDTWYNNYSKGYIEKSTEMINKFAEANNVDKDRIYVYGCSAGGYMTLRMAIENPNLFAAVIANCPAINVAPERGGIATTQAEIESIAKNKLWLVHAADDTTVVPETSSRWVKSILKDAIYTEYENVKVDNVSYSGHWAWIYTALNMPKNSAGENIWQWTAKQTLFVEKEPEKEPEKAPEKEPEKKPIVETSDISSIGYISLMGALSLVSILKLKKRKNEVTE